jgi:hypothetical protein
MKRKINGTTASYKTKIKGEYKCDLIMLAKAYSELGNVPKSIGDKKAMEISLLSRAYLTYVKNDKTKVFK